LTAPGPQQHSKVSLTQALAWIVLGALAGISAYGFCSARLFSQWIWLPSGLGRLGAFSACYAAIVTVLILWRPRWLRAVMLGIPLTYTLVAVGVIAPVAAAYVLLSALMFGRWILRAPTNEDDLPALFVGLSVWVALVSLAVRFPINYPAVYAVALAVPIVWNVREIPAILRRVRAQLLPQDPCSRTENATLALLLFALLAQWVVTLKPEVSSDGLGMHLVIPAQVEARHHWAFDFRQFTWALMPAGGDWAFTLVYLLGGEYAARLLNFSLLILICAMLASAMRPWLPRSLTLLAAALFAVTPLVQAETGSLFVENFWAGVFVAGVLTTARFHETGEARYLYAAACLFGTTVAVKFGALAFAVPALVVLGAELVRRRERVKRWLRAALAFLALAAPPYVTAWLMTGNPVYPFLNRVFRSPYFDSAINFRNERYVTPLSWHTPFDITFHSARFLEAQNGSLGFQYFLLLPVAILLVRRNWPYLARLALGLSIAGFVLTFLGQSYLRYIYPALPLFTIAIAAAIGSASARLRYTLVAAATAAFFFNMYFLAASGYYHQDFFLNLFDRAEVDRYLEQFAPERRAVEYLNRKGPDIRVAFLDEDRIGDLHGHPFALGWRSYQYSQALDASGTAEDDLRTDTRFGITYFVAPTRESGSLLAHVYTRDFLDRYTLPEYRFGKAYVARLRDECRTGTCEPLSAILPLPPAIAGAYENIDRHFIFHGPWTRGKFLQAASGTVTYASQRNAEFTFRFAGTAITWIFTRAYNRGRAQVTIDGLDLGIVDQYAPETAWQSSRTFAGLSPGDHALTVRVLGEKTPASADCFIDVDRVVVR